MVEESDESWEQTARKIQLLATEKLGINENIQIERAYRVERPNPQRPRTIVAKFLRYNDKENLIRNSIKLKGTNTREILDFGGISLTLRGSGAAGTTFGAPIGAPPVPIWETAAFGGGERE